MTQIMTLDGPQTSKDSAPPDPQCNSGQQSHKPTDSSSRAARRTAASNKRKRKNTSANNTNETAETSKSCISLQLEQRLNGTNEKIFAEAHKSNKSKWSTRKTKRQRRNRNNENIEESKNDSYNCTSGVKTSRSVVKLTKLDDFVLTNYVLSHGKNKTGSKTVRRRGLSAQSKNEEPVAETRNEFDKLSIEEKKENLRTKRTIPPQKFRFNVPESPGNVKKKDSRKSHGIPSPNENHETVEPVPNIGKKSKELIEATIPDSKLSETKNTEIPEKSCNVEADSSSNVSQTQSFKKDTTKRQRNDKGEKLPAKKIIRERRKSKIKINAPTVGDKNSGKKTDLVIEKTAVVETFDASATDLKLFLHKTDEFNAETTIRPNFTSRKDEVNSSKPESPKISSESERSNVPQPTTPQNSVCKEEDDVAKPHSRRSRNKNAKNKNTITVPSISPAEKTEISDAASNSSSLFDNNKELNFSNPNSSNSFHKPEANIKTEMTTLFHVNTSSNGLDSDSSTCENNPNEKTESNLHHSPSMPIRIKEEPEDPSTTARISSDNDQSFDEVESFLLKTEISYPMETNAETEVYTPTFLATGNNYEVNNIAIPSEQGGKLKKRSELPNPMENPQPQIKEEMIIDEITTGFSVSCETVWDKNREVNGDENEEERIRPAKRRGRTSGMFVQGWDGDVGQVRERGRGRGRGRSRPGLTDAEYVPRLESAPAKNNDEKTDDQSHSQDPKNEKSTSDELECAKCMKQMAETEWAKHNLVKHNGMGWITGTPKPDYENNVKLLRSVLMAKLKKRSLLNCESCGIAKRSADGFISHLQFCGMTDEERRSLLVACRVCGSVMMPSSMEVHERTHRQVDKPTEQKKWEVAMDVTSSKSKRKAAEKAATKISEFTDDVEDVKNQCSEDKLGKLVKKPRSDVPVVWKGIWNKELATNGKAFCRQPTCQFTADSIKAMCEHNSVCPFALPPKLVCKLCHFSSDTEEVVTNHVREKHWDNKRDVDSASDFDPDSSNDLDTDSASNSDLDSSIDEKS